jgi:hypothetical protein
MELVEITKTAGLFLAAAGGIFASVLGFLNRDKIMSVKLLINGRIDQLLAATHKSGRADERADIAAGYAPPVPIAAVPDSTAAKAAAEFVVDTAAATAAALVSAAAPPLPKS